MIQLALFEPEIPQNVGTTLRLASCMGLGIHIIEPCGFVWSNKHLKRAGMDYLEKVCLLRHDSWESFLKYTQNKEQRLVFLDVKGRKSYTDFSFRDTDIIIAGREGNGFSGLDYPFLKESIRIPLLPDRRSLNVAVSISMVTGEALRQKNAFPS